MGEYANDQYRKEVKQMFGFDPGDDDGPKKQHKKPIYQKATCTICKKQVRERGLWQHMRDVHGVLQVVQAIEAAKQGGLNGTS